MGNFRLPWQLIVCLVENESACMIWYFGSIFFSVKWSFTKFCTCSTRSRTIHDTWGDRIFDTGSDTKNTLRKYRVSDTGSDTKNHYPKISGIRNLGYPNSGIRSWEKKCKLSSFLRGLRSQMMNRSMKMIICRLGKLKREII